MRDLLLLNDHLEGWVTGGSQEGCLEGSALRPLRLPPCTLSQWDLSHSHDFSRQPYCHNSRVGNSSCDLPLTHGHFLSSSLGDPTGTSCSAGTGLNSLSPPLLPPWLKEGCPAKNCEVIPCPSLPVSIHSPSPANHALYIYEIYPLLRLSCHYWSLGNHFLFPRQLQ